MKRKGVLMLLLAVGAGIAIMLYKSPAQKRAALVADATGKGDMGTVAIYNRMSDAEIAVMYTFIFDYAKKGLPQPDASTALGQQLNAILLKYAT
jgi:hypothetical protein